MLYKLKARPCTRKKTKQNPTAQFIAVLALLWRSLYRGDLDLSPQYPRGAPVHARLPGASLSLGADGPGGGVCSLLRAKFRDALAGSREQK